MSLANKTSITDVDVKGKRVVVRVDFNVPIKEGKVASAGRIIGALPTIKYLLSLGMNHINTYPSWQFE